MAPSKKTLLFVCLLVAAVAVVVPVAQGQLGPVSNLLSVVGTVFCSANVTATVGTGGVTAPPFSNATVQLVCGQGNGTVVAVTVTNSTGQFIIGLPVSSVNALLTFVTQVLYGSCRVVVVTPLASCNPSLPSVGYLTGQVLTSLLKEVNGILAATVTIGNFTVSA